MNLAVHGLEGDIREGISYYDDPHDTTGRFDFVLANPPFNVKGFEKLSAQRGKGFEKVVTPASIGFENRQKSNPPSQAQRHAHSMQRWPR
jgi:type I restriction-modification system DNA methylase subunit